MTGEEGFDVLEKGLVVEDVLEGKVFADSGFVGDSGDAVGQQGLDFRSKNELAVLPVIV